MGQEAHHIRTDLKEEMEAEAVSEMVYLMEIIDLDQTAPIDLLDRKHRDQQEAVANRRQRHFRTHQTKVQHLRVTLTQVCFQLTFLTGSKIRKVYDYRGPENCTQLAFFFFF